MVVHSTFDSMKATDIPSVCRRHGDRRAPIIRLAWGLLVALLLFGAPACSTIKMAAHPKQLTKEGIRAAGELGRIGSPATTGFSKEAAELLKQAQTLDSRGDELRAAACFLKVAVDARAHLRLAKEAPGSPGIQPLLDIHNRAMARFAEIWTKVGAPRQLAFQGANYKIVQAPGSDYNFGYFDKLVAARSLEVKGMVEKERPGYGTPLVGIRLRTPEREEEMKFFPYRGMHVSATMVMGDPRRKAGATMVPISILNPELHETVRADGRPLPLAANFSASLEMLLAGRNELLWGLEGFFDAKKRASKSGLFLLEPYDPKRIPIVLVHGLVSVPIIWRDLMPELMAEPDIAKRYQFMTFTYPSSYNIAESARLFRQSLAAMRAKYDPAGKDPLSNNMVVVGHSMGGMLSHILVADIGGKLWNKISDKDLDSLDMSPKNRGIVRSLAFFKPDPAAKRIIFIATPHRGSEMARINIAKFASSLVKLPGRVLKTTTILLDDPAFAEVRRRYGTKITSVQSLRPDAPMVEALNVSPYKKGVIYHSIIGDRGKGDTPNSSDGVVEYWSSHQDGAASEIIVPADHSGTYKDPNAVKEIKRILRIHAGL